MGDWKLVGMLREFYAGRTIVSVWTQGNNICVVCESIVRW